LKAQKPLPEAYPKELRTVGDHLRKRRLELGLLQKEVARLLGVHPATINNWENNHREPSLRGRLRLLDFLQVNEEVLTSDKT